MTELRRHLLMMFRGKAIAVPAAPIYEVMQCQRIFDLPSPDTRVRGLILAGTNAVPVLSLFEQEAETPRVVVLLNTVHGLIALPADRVIRVDSVQEHPLPDLMAKQAGSLASRWPGLIGGIAKIEDEDGKSHTAICLNIDAIGPAVA